MKQEHLIEEFIERAPMNNWNAMTCNERLDLLQEFENIVAKAEGRDAVKIYAMTKEEVITCDNSEGFYSHEKNAIFLNPKYLEKRNNITGIEEYSIAAAMATIAHEGRHAWQQYVVKHPGIVDERTRLDILANQIVYHQPVDEETYTLYQAQLIELDARRFEKELISFISDYITERDGVPNPAFYRQKRLMTRIEENAARRIESYYDLEKFEELEKETILKFISCIKEIYDVKDMEEVKDVLKEEYDFEDVDLSDISVFNDAIRLIETKDISEFVDGHLIGYKDNPINYQRTVDKIDYMNIYKEKTREYSDKKFQ